MQTRTETFSLPLPDRNGHQPIHLVHFDPASWQDRDRLGLVCEPSPEAGLQRQAEFVAGRLAAREALRQLGLPDSFPRVGTECEPLWPAGICGSITHREHKAMAAVMRGASTRNTGGLGIDLEAIMDTDMAQELATELLVSDQEKQLIEQSGLGFELGMTLAFSAKESLFKALYPLTRCFKEFSAARLVALSRQPAAFCLQLSEDWSERWAAGRLIQGSWQQQGQEVVTLIRIEPESAKHPYRQA